MAEVSTGNRNTWMGALNDGGIRTDLASLAATGTLDYSAAMQLLKDVGSDGVVTSVEYGDLQTVAAHLNAGLSTSSYVASIFDHLVLGSPANAMWYGGTASATPLGDLHGGSSSAQLDQLIGKWFLGSDLPDATVYDGNVARHRPSYISYNLPLFGPDGVPAVSDIAQGSAGDCVLCAGMIDMVQHHQDLLSSMIVDNGNNTYGVRFYVDGNEDWITVNNQLPSLYGGMPTYAKTDAGGTPVLWVALVEKAYAQLSASGLINHPAVNSYNNIWADQAATVQANLFNASPVTYYLSGNTSWGSSKAAIVAAIANHQDVTVETAANSSTLYDADGNQTLIPNHSHAVIGYDAATGNFIVRNPWGQSATQNWLTQFEVSMDTIAAQHGAITVAAPAAQTISASVGAHAIGGGAAFAVSQLFELYNPEGLQVNGYSLQLQGKGALKLNGAMNLASTEQAAQGVVTVSAADLSKLLYVAPASGDAGVAALQVSAQLGQNWSQPGSVPISFFAGRPANQTDSVAVLGNPGQLLVSGSSLPLSALFHTSSGQATYYTVYAPGDKGSLDLHGVKTLEAGSKLGAGYYQFAAEDLARVTFSLADGKDSAVLAAAALVDNAWTSFQEVPVYAGRSVAQAMQAASNGQLAAASTVLDSSANIFANLDWIQARLNQHAMQALVLNDMAATPRLTGAQLKAAQGALTMLSGQYQLAITDLPLADAVNLPDTLQRHIDALSVTAPSSDIAAQLATLQSMLTSSHLNAIHVTDQALPHLTLNGAQLAADAAVLALLNGAYYLSYSGSAGAIAAGVSGLPAARQIDFAVKDSTAGVIAQLDALQSLAAAGKLNSISLTDSGIPTVLLTPEQLSSDALALSKLTGNYRLGSTLPLSVSDALTASGGKLTALAIADSADAVASHLDALQALYSSGKLVSLTLTDNDTPALMVSAAQLARDAGLLHTIASPCAIRAPGISTGVAQFVIGQNAAQHAVTAGANSGAGNAAIGFQSASFASGYNAVVLDQARSHYALRVDGSGTLQIKDIAPEDATFGQSVNVTHASYLVFDAATSNAQGNYASIYFIADGARAAVAELYVAAFGRQPDLAGLEYWQTLVSKGVSLSNVAASFADSNEFKSRFVSAAAPGDHGGASDQAFVTAVYSNVLHRAPDAGGFDFWVNTLAHSAARADLLISFATSAENITNTHVQAGHDGGWLIDTASGGYADGALSQHMVQLVGVPH